MNGWRGGAPGALIAALAAAALGQALGWPPPAQLCLRMVAAGAAGLLLLQCQRLLAGIPHAGMAPRLHILLHLAPLGYFLLETAWNPSAWQWLFLPLLILFFVTGSRTWSLCHRLTGRGIYRLFAIGNLQMTFYFPLALALDRADWPSPDPGWFEGLITAYFLIHFLLTSWIVPLLERDLTQQFRSALASRPGGAPPGHTS